MRKTTKMKALLETANAMLTNPKLSQEVKKGVALLLETALHESDSYSGYNNYKSDINAQYSSMTSCGPQDEGYQEWTRIYYAPKGGF